MLPYDWSKEGASRALPRIQQIYKRFALEHISLALAGQSAETASSHQRIDWDGLIDQFREVRPQANERT